MPNADKGKKSTFFADVINGSPKHFFQILGLTAISETRGASWGHLYGYSHHARLGFSLMREAFPGRLSSLHFMKPPTVRTKEGSKRS